MAVGDKASCSDKVKIKLVDTYTGREWPYFECRWVPRKEALVKCGDGVHRRVVGTSDGFYGKVVYLQSDRDSCNL